MSQEEDKYVLRTEWIQNTGKIYEKINENDRKHIEAYSTLDKRLENKQVYKKNSLNHKSD